MTILDGFGTFPIKEQDKALSFADSGYTLLQNDAVLRWNTSGGSCVCNLPDLSTAPDVFRQSLYYLCKTSSDGNSLSITPFAGDTIGGVGAPIIIAGVQSVLLYASSTTNDWIVLVAPLGVAPIPFTAITGLAPQELLFGGALGGIDQSTELLFDGSTLFCYPPMHLGRDLKFIYPGDAEGNHNIFTDDAPDETDGPAIFIQTGKGGDAITAPAGNGGELSETAGRGGAASATDGGGLGGVRSVIGGRGGNGSAAQPAGQGGGLVLRSGRGGTDNGGGGAQPGPVELDTGIDTSGTSEIVSIGGTNAEGVEIGRSGKDSVVNGNAVVQEAGLVKGNFQTLTGQKVSDLLRTAANSPYTSTVDDFIVRWDTALGACTHDLPDITTVRNQHIFIGKVSADVNALTILPQAGQTVATGAGLMVGTVQTKHLYAPTTGLDWMLLSGS